MPLYDRIKLVFGNTYTTIYSENYKSNTKYRYI